MKNVEMKRKHDPSLKRPKRLFNEDNLVWVPGFMFMF